MLLLPPKSTKWHGGAAACAGWAIGPWPTQNFCWVGHNAFGPTNNWPACSLVQESPAEARVARDSSAKTPESKLIDANDG